MGSTLELTVQRAVDGGWPVVAEHHRAGQVLPVRSEGQLALKSEPVSASPRGYGEALGRALFTGSIRDAYVAARNDAPVRVWVSIEEPTLRTWRWEWLCGPVDGSRWDFLSLDQRALYSLYLPSLTDRPYPAIGRRDLRALVVVANPTDVGGRYGLTAFDAATPVRRLRAVFEGRVACDVLARVPDAVGPPTLDALVTQLTTGASSGPYSILHLVCHGWFDRDAEETWVYLEQPTVDASGVAPVQPVSADTLIERLARVAELPHLMFLSVCESSAPEAEQRLGGLAQRLVRELGIPAVIGMTEPVTVPTAQMLSAAFYQRLLEPQDTGVVDRALVTAYAGLASRPDVHVPALFSRLGAQPLFSVAVDRPLTATEIRAGLDTLNALLTERAPVLQPQLASHRQALEPWLVTDVNALSADARQTRETSLKAITEICQEGIDINFHALAAGEPVPAYDPRQPFRGMSPFRPEDHEFFFGRDALVETLARKLTADPFLPVLGPSGSGKSSVVLAGLVSRLQREEPALQLAYLTPGSRPLEQLRAVQATLRGGPVLYVVDQFEEVFTACRDEAQRRAFIEAMLELAARDRVVVTMRADFWGECAPYLTLKARMQARQELIASMTTTELRSAMDQQAATVGLRFETDLSQTMLDEVAGEPGAMPLLQHALLELWKRRHGRWLRAAEYRAIGGVKQAIAETADRLYAELSPEEQDRMRDIFLRLTQLGEHVTQGEERRNTRRRVPFADLVPAELDGNVTKALVKRLADAVLVVTSRNPVTHQDEVEVAHEALIRHWPKLRNSLDEHQVALQARRSLERAAREWLSSGRSPDYLQHSGARLHSLRDFMGQVGFSMNSVEDEYVKACEERDQRRLTKEIQERYVCNNLREVNAWKSARGRPFDLIVIGGGTFGPAIAYGVWFRQKQTGGGLRTLIIEAGMFTVADHVQNLGMQGLTEPAPFLLNENAPQPEPPRNEVWRIPWKSSIPFKGLPYTLGGRSLYWAGWSPQPLDSELTTWPTETVDDLRSRYFYESSRQMGVDETNDFIFGDLHNVLRRRLFDNLSSVTGTIPLSSLPSPPLLTSMTVDARELHELLGLAPTDVLSLGDLQNLLKHEAPLAVQGRGFSLSRFSSMPLLKKAAFTAYADANGNNAIKDFMILPETHALSMSTTQTGAARWRVTGVHTSNGFIELASGGSAVIALGTIESARLALLSFDGSGIPTLPLMGKNLMAHLRSNLLIQVPRAAIPELPVASAELEVSALFVKCRAVRPNGDLVGHFHLQIVASGGNTAGAEDELFKKIPDVEFFDHLRTSNDTRLAIAIRGIGEMEAADPNQVGAHPSSVKLDPSTDEHGISRAVVTLVTTPRDDELWNFMDATMQEVARVFANGHPIEVIHSKRDGLGDTHDEAGTLWMGTDPAKSVTDANGRFHYTENLYTAGPCLFPSIGSANPMLAGIALARRTADHISTRPALSPIRAIER